MIVLVEYSDGSQKVRLDDGREVILSSPYSDGSRKIFGEDGSSGWLTDKYNDGSRRATMDDGTVYSVEEKNFLLFGKQNIWEKIKNGGVGSLSHDEAEEAKSILSSLGTSSSLEQEIDSYIEEQNRRIRYEEEQIRQETLRQHEELLRQEEESRRQDKEDEDDDRWYIEEEDEEDEDDSWSNFNDEETENGSSRNEDVSSVDKKKDAEEINHQTVKLNLDDVYKGTKRSIKVGSKSYMVALKPGLSSGNKVRMSGILPNNKDYYLFIEVEPDWAYFDELNELSNTEIKGKDVYFDYEIDIFTAALGGEETIDHPLGLVSFSIPSQIEPETKIRIPRYGLPQYDNPEISGDLVVTIKVKKAKRSLTHQQRTLLISYIAKHC